MRSQTLDPDIEDAYAERPYSMCDNNMENRTDPDGRFWNYFGGALLGAGVEFAGQVATNMISVGRRIIATGVSEIAKNTLDVTAEKGAKINSDRNIAKNTAIGLVSSGVSSFAKVGKIATTSKNQAVKIARNEARIASDQV